MQPVQEIEQQRDGDEPDQQRQGEGGIHGVGPAQTCSMTMPLISFATSSKRSTTFSS